MFRKCIKKCAMYVLIYGMLVGCGNSEQNLEVETVESVSTEIQEEMPSMVMESIEETTVEEESIDENVEMEEEVKKQAVPKLITINGEDDGWGNVQNVYEFSFDEEGDIKQITRQYVDEEFQYYIEENDELLDGKNKKVSEKYTYTYLIDEIGNKIYGINEGQIDDILKIGSYADSEFVKTPLIESVQSNYKEVSTECGTEEFNHMSQYKYNEDNLLVELVIDNSTRYNIKYENDNLWTISMGDAKEWTYSTDDSGFLIYYNTHHYDGEGNITKKYERKFERDENNQITKEIKYTLENISGEIDAREESKKIEWEYDESGNTTLERCMDSFTGEVIEKTTMSYDEKGLLIGKKYEGNVTSYEEVLEYDELGRMIEDDYHHSDYVQKILYEYDVQNQLVMKYEAYLWSDNTTSTYETVFSYDENGRLVAVDYNGIRAGEILYNSNGLPVTIKVTEYNIDFDEHVDELLRTYIGYTYEDNSSINMSVNGVDIYATDIKEMNIQWY